MLLKSNQWRQSIHIVHVLINASKAIRINENLYIEKYTTITTQEEQNIISAPVLKILSL